MISPRTLVSVVLLPAAAAYSTAQSFSDVEPTPQQVAWQALEIGVLIRLGPNSFMERREG